MTMYAASSVTAYVPPGGVCKGHSIEDDPSDPDYEFLAISCGVCEPLLANDPFWANSPEERPLTAREEREQERLKAEAERHRQQMDAARDNALIALAAKLTGEHPAEDADEAPKPKGRTRKSSGASA